MDQIQVLFWKELAKTKKITKEDMFVRALLRAKGNEEKAMYLLKKAFTPYTNARKLAANPHKYYTLDLVNMYMNPKWVSRSYQLYSTLSEEERISLRDFANRFWSTFYKNA